MKPWTKFQDWGTLVLGVLLYIAPWVFATTTNASSSWNVWIVGIVIVVMSLLALARPGAFGYEWISLLAGVWLFFVPWFFGFAAAGAIMAWTAWIIGVLTVALAVWKLLEVRSQHVPTTAL